MKRNILTFLLAAILILSSCGNRTDLRDQVKTAEPSPASSTSSTEETAAVVKEEAPHDHVWQDATCQAPQTCSICGKTRGATVGHRVEEWNLQEEATCAHEGIRTGTCVVCGELITEIIGMNTNHQILQATCTDPEVCTICGSVYGPALGHDIEEWETIQESTCTTIGKERGICTRCGETVEQDLPLKAHTPGDWEITREATLERDGLRQQRCTVCGKLLKEEKIILTAEEKMALYKKQCVKVSYKDLARDPDAYKGQMVYVTGEVIQVMEASSSAYYCIYRVDITKGSYGIYTDTVYIYYDGYGKTPRILEDDIVTFYGKYDGLTSYTTVMGATVTLPCIYAEYIEIVK